jgi:hypothetical protein
MIDVVAAAAVGWFLADPVRREQATEFGRAGRVRHGKPHDREAEVGKGGASAASSVSSRPPSI